MSRAIDATLYLLARIYEPDAAGEVAAVIEYERAYTANRNGLGTVVTDRARLPQQGRMR